MKKKIDQNNTDDASRTTEHSNTGDRLISSAARRPVNSCVGVHRCFIGVWRSAFCILHFSFFIFHSRVSHVVL